MSLIDKSNLLEYYENGQLETYKSFSIDSPNTFNFCDIEKKSVGGLPLVSYRKGENLQVTFTEDTHALVIGATRSGKTTSFIIPTILLKGKQKQKDNMLITDPKGELYTKCAESLRAEGYKIVLLNFRDYNNSECWNPLTPIFRKYQDMTNIENNISTLKDKGKYYNTFNKKVFQAQEELNREVERERAILYKSIQDDIDNLAQKIITVENKRDPYWELSSKELFKAFVYAMLEDSIKEQDNEHKITEDNFSFRTILDIYDTFNFETGNSIDRGYFSKRAKSSKAFALAKATILANASNTRLCILSSFEAKMAPYRDVVANLITSCNTFDFDSLILGNKPVAIFISYRDEIKTSYFVIQQYIVSVYTKLIELANQNKNLCL
ncbi:MAG: type IV secretory system conjugative DNA transfer family protein, partial [Clostridia bacterium]